MRILLSALLTLSLLGCAAAEEPAVTEAPTAEVNPAPGSEEAASTEQEAEDSETEPASETEIDPEQSEADAEAEASAKPTSPPTRTQAQATEKATSEPTEEQTEEPSEEASQPAPKPTSSQDGYTLAQVAEKNSQSACWVAIDGMVYDLTDWIRSHPGGRSSILSLCGTDGTSSFLSQHGGQARPSATLDRYLLGPLVR